MPDGTSSVAATSLQLLVVTTALLALSTSPSVFLIVISPQLQAMMRCNCRWGRRGMHDIRQG